MTVHHIRLLFFFRMNSFLCINAKFIKRVARVKLSNKFHPAMKCFQLNQPEWKHRGENKRKSNNEHKKLYIYIYFLVLFRIKKFVDSLQFKKIGFPDKGNVCEIIYIYTDGKVCSAEIGREPPTLT